MAATAKPARSRGGCRTCKIRRIKCDEQKPSCRRCQSTGRQCDGYNPEPNLSNSSESTTLSRALISTRSERDNRGFDYFQYNVVEGMTTHSHNPDFWTYLVPQLSEASPAVLRAVLSLSALHEHSYNTSETQRISNDNVVFLRQYNKSIRHLCARQCEQPIQITLTCCIIYICLENIRGNYDTALNHLKSGLYILQDWQSRTVESGPEEKARDIIAAIFYKLDIQATTFLDNRQPLMPRMSVAAMISEPATEQKRPEFEDINEAQRILEKIIMRLFYVLTMNSAPGGPSWSPRNDYLPARKHLLVGMKRQFLSWKESFDMFLLRESGSFQSKDLRLSLLVGLNYRTSLLMLEIRIGEDYQGKYIGPSNDESFAQIFDICRTLIKASTATKPTFTADLGVIAHLYFAAMTAPSRSTRQEAIDLLRQINWKEGFWHAETVAQIAEKEMQKSKSEKQGAVTAGIPALAKYHCVAAC